MPHENVPVKVGLLELLKGSMGTQFVIPAYQRNYTWSASKEVYQLFEDLEAVLSGERSKHFIGIMIYLEKAITPFQTERSVIDGQQRLTTIFLTLYAIKELLISDGKVDEANKLDTMYLTNPYLETQKYKLKPLVSDDNVYQHIVNRDYSNIPDRNSNVFLNFVYIKKALKLFNSVYSLDEILLAMNKLYIVCVPIGEDDYPQKIFESINATGAKLTASDLIRNFILMPIVSDLQDEYYEKYWRRIETLVDNDSKKLEAFFRFFIMAKRRTLINKNAIYRSFISWYNDVEGTLGVEGIFNEIVKYASYYNDIYKKPIEYLDTPIQEPINEFREILSDMPAPLLMELYSIHKQSSEDGDGITSSQFAEIVTILNSYLMRRSLCNMDTSDISRYFPDLPRLLLDRCNGTYKDVVNAFIEILIDNNRGTPREMPNDKRLVERIKHANMYSLKIWIDIFFRKLESDGNPAPVDFSQLSIEHLLPQTPTARIMEELGVTKDVYEENVHRLGNLTLASKPDNSRMGNNIWGYKNKVLASTSHLKMNEKLLQKDSWEIDDIEERTNELIKEIARLYPYFEKKAPSTAVANTISNNNVDETGKIQYLYINEGGINAEGEHHLDSGDVVVKAGSMVKLGINGIHNKEVIKHQKHFLEKGIICNDGRKVYFKSDHTFPGSEGNAMKISSFIILCQNGMWRTKRHPAASVDSYSIAGNTSAKHEHNYARPIVRNTSEYAYISREPRRFLTMEKPPKESKKSYLRIEFGDGTVITENIAIDTLRSFVMYVGIDRVRSLRLTQNGEFLIDRPNYNNLDDYKTTRWKSLEHGWHLFTCMNNNEKVKHIEEIIRRLRLDAKVRLLKNIQ